MTEDTLFPTVTPAVPGSSRTSWKVSLPSRATLSWMMVMVKQVWLLVVLSVDVRAPGKR